MADGELERVMTEFIERRVDVLISRIMESADASRFGEVS